MKRTGSVSPEIFRIGNIVELAVSFVVRVSGPDKFRMSIQLKSVRLLDREETNVSHLFSCLPTFIYHFYFIFYCLLHLKNARMMSMIDNRDKKSVKLTVPKRKKTYTKEEETAEAQFKLFKMRIDKGPSPLTMTRSTDVAQEISSEM